ncbi:hypothetical protein VDGE_30117 [Verticillium dahliae]|uniref:Uncharacterized protein n=1 Tax=Verticillium dahliae TaxID=27337 RepID=A0A444S8A2_VERDA|nr:hypothetical protein VDGE_30117 [Verticillium dahliae]
MALFGSLPPMLTSCLSSRRITVLPAQGRRPVPPRPPREIQEGGKDLHRLISGLASDIDELASSGLTGLPNDVGLSVSAVSNSRSCCIFHYARLLVGVRERASEGEKGGRDTGGMVGINLFLLEISLPDLLYRTS